MQTIAMDCPLLVSMDTSMVRQNNALALFLMLFHSAAGEQPAQTVLLVTLKIPKFPRIFEQQY